MIIEKRVSTREIVRLLSVKYNIMIEDIFLIRKEIGRKIDKYKMGWTLIDR